MDLTKLTLGECCQINRRRAKKNQRAVAKEMGVTRQAVSLWEVGQFTQNAPEWMLAPVDVKGLDPAERVYILRKRLRLYQVTAAPLIAKTFKIRSQELSDAECGRRNPNDVLRVLEKMYAEAAPQKPPSANILDWDAAWVEWAEKTIKDRKERNRIIKLVAGTPARTVPNIRHKPRNSKNIKGQPPINFLERETENGREKN
jgi:transcriptional regulator with XRE-family HTH domain